MEFQEKDLVMVNIGQTGQELNHHRCVGQITGIDHEGKLRVRFATAGLVTATYRSEEIRPANDEEKAKWVIWRITDRPSLVGYFGKRAGLVRTVGESDDQYANRVWGTLNKSPKWASRLHGI